MYIYIYIWINKMTEEKEAQRFFMGFRTESKNLRLICELKIHRIICTLPLKPGLLFNIRMKWKKIPGTRTKITNDWHFIDEKDLDFGHLRYKDYSSVSYLLLKKSFHFFSCIFPRNGASRDYHQPFLASSTRMLRHRRLEFKFWKWILQTGNF